MLEKVISGGQTGADQAGWRIARRFGIPTGGAMPRGFLTEDGPRPEFAEMFGASELETDSYAARTEQNIRDPDATIWFGDPASPGGRLTLAWCLRLGKPCPIVAEDGGLRPPHVAACLSEGQVRVLNVAGNRESTEPGIGPQVGAFLAAVFRRLGLEEGARPSPPPLPRVHPLWVHRFRVDLPCPARCGMGYYAGSPAA